MIHIDEWQSPEWVKLDWDAIPPAPGARPQAPPDPPGARPSRPADAFRASLESLPQPGPNAVHFYKAEGLRWIRVGFDRPGMLQPASVAEVGAALASCLPRRQVLYFHALRPHDLLFFLDDGDPGKAGLGPEHFGQPLGQVLQAWGLAAAPAPRQRARARAVSAAG